MSKLENSKKIHMPSWIRKEFNYVRLVSMDRSNYFFGTEDDNFIIHFDSANNEWTLIELSWEPLTEEELKNDGRLSV